MTKDQLAYHLDEYRALRQEVAFHQRMVYGAFGWAVIASGVITTWLVANAESIQAIGGFPARVVWFVPGMVCVFAWLGFYHFHTVLMLTGGYLKRLEEALAAEGLGWEQYLAELRSGAIGNQTIIRFAVGWAALILSNFVLAIFMQASFS